MIRILGTTFAALLGLAFGSFLNVCLSRWPTGESIIHPRSHCRNCAHALSWWENIPLLSWLILRARCRTCHTAISLRYPLVELSVGSLWGYSAWHFMREILDPRLPDIFTYYDLVALIGIMIFYWLLVALAALDAENLWLPDWITLSGIVLGFLTAITKSIMDALSPIHDTVNRFEVIRYETGHAALDSILSILAAALLILIIRWLYKLIRHQEGIGLGDAKLMALLAAWLGFPGAILSFVLAAILGAAVALVVLAVPSARTNPQSWATSKLPLGTFLCIGGIVTSLWGQHLIDAYLRWAGL